MRSRDRLAANVRHWPASWPALSGSQRVQLRALRRRVPGAFVGAVDAFGVARVIVLDHRVREWALLHDGRMRRVLPGEPLELAA